MVIVNILVCSVTNQVYSLLPPDAFIEHHSNGTSFFLGCTGIYTIETLHCNPSFTCIFLLGEEELLGKKSSVLSLFPTEWQPYSGCSLHSINE